MRTVLIIHRCNVNFGNGGVEKYIRAQIKRYNQVHMDCLTVFPVRKRIAGISLEFYGVMQNTKMLGIYEKKEVMDYFLQIQKSGVRFESILIHHLMNFELDSLKQVVSVVNADNVKLYVHDYYTACIQYNLLKNDEAYCGNAQLDEKKCEGCRYYQEAAAAKKRVVDLLQEMKEKLEVIVPSEITRQLWCGAFPEFEGQISIVPHLLMEGKYEGNKEPVSIESVKIGFVGEQSHKKGWDKWKTATDNLWKQDKKRIFYYIGAKTDDRPFIKNINASIETGGNHAMVNALREHSVDCVVLFSGCPETYSYVFFEALAANAYVITCKDSGNIASAAAQFQNGIVLENTAGALTDYLADTKRLLEDINRFKKSDFFGPLYLHDNLHIEGSVEQFTLPKIHGQRMSLKKATAKLLYWCRYHKYYG